MKKNKKDVFVVKKVWDEGTTSPFPARLMLQMFTFRDELLNVLTTFNPVIQRC